MKIQTTSFLAAVTVLLLITISATADAQQYKLRQVTSVSGMKSESTIYVKGMRKRTEGGGFMGVAASPVTIEQCDLQRTIKINDKKKLYYIEPFSKQEEEVIEEDAKPVAVKSKPAPADKAKDKTGGVIYMYQSITDTGERKKMYGFTARHVWSTQKIKPSADACMMKDSMIIKTDGWYIDLPQFNCPVRSYTNSGMKRGTYQPDCRDRFVTRRSGKGRMGFPLVETKTMIMGNGPAQNNEFATSMETLEFSAMKLDSMLFEIPTGYQETKNEEDLQEKMDVNALMKQYGYEKTDKTAAITDPDAPKKEGIIRIAVLAPTGEESLSADLLQKHLAGALVSDKTEAVAVNSEEEAKNSDCDLLLTTTFTKVKQGSKVGSLLKAIKNTDPSASSSFNIEAVLKLTSIGDGSKKAEEKVAGKYDGKADEAAMKALDKACNQLLKEIR